MNELRVREKEKYESHKCQTRFCDAEMSHTLSDPFQ